MGEVSGVKNEGKISYEKLEILANQLGQQVDMLQKQLRESVDFMYIKRLEFLFKVLENSNV